MRGKVLKICLLMLTTALLVNVGKICAETIDVSTGILATASITGTFGLSIQARNRTTHAVASSVDWGSVGNTCALANNYIVLSATANYSVWKVDIYTKNVPRVSTNTAYGVYQCAGLINDDASNGTTTFIRVPLLWIVSGSTLPATLNLGVSSTTTNTIYGSTTSVQMCWMYVKDKADQDDPTIGGDQSWNYSHSGGYTVCLYGGPSYRNLPVGITTGNPNYVYLEGDFAGAAGGKNYSSTIWFDLYH